MLNSQPTGDVTVGLSSSDPTEGTISVASVTFTTANWNVPQTVSITGVNDELDDGDIGYTIVTAVATSSDGNYNGLNASDVSVTNIDNDTAGITVTPTSGLTTTEAGGTATFTVVLNSQPTADVTIGLSSNDTTEGTAGPSSLTFTNANWNIPQTATITGANDALDDGDIAYAIVTAPATSADGNYNTLNASDVSVINTDDDTAGITVTPTSGLTTTEAGGTATFTIVLNSQPTAGVTIGLSSSDPTEGTVSAPSVAFTTANWNTPFCLSPHDPKTLYYGGHLVFKSTDRGESWTRISPELTRPPKGPPGPTLGHTVSALTESPVKVGVLSVTAGIKAGIYDVSKKTEFHFVDGGKTVLPLGTYFVKVSGAFAQVVIEENKVTEF